MQVRSPSSRVKGALTTLLSMYALVGLEGIWQLIHPSAPQLFSELFASLALWEAFRTAQRASS